jgi:hypothetical protein
VMLSFVFFAEMNMSHGVTLRTAMIWMSNPDRLPLRLEKRSDKVFFPRVFCLRGLVAALHLPLLGDFARTTLVSLTQIRRSDNRYILRALDLSVASCDFIMTARKSLFPHWQVLRLVVGQCKGAQAMQPKYVFARLT